MFSWCRMESTQVLDLHSPCLPVNGTLPEVAEFGVVGGWSRQKVTNFSNRVMIYTSYEFQQQNYDLHELWIYTNYDQQSYEMSATEYGVIGGWSRRWMKSHTEYTFEFLVLELLLKMASYSTRLRSQFRDTFKIMNCIYDYYNATQVWMSTVWSVLWCQAGCISGLEFLFFWILLLGQELL